MAYLGNDDLGRSLQIGGNAYNPMYSQMEDDFVQRVGSGTNKYKPTALYLGSGNKKDVEKLGETMAKMIADQNPELVASGIMTGGSFWDSIKKGFHKVVKAVKKVAPAVKAVAPLVAPGYGTALVTGMNAVGLGQRNNNRKHILSVEEAERLVSGRGKAKKPRKKRATSDKMKKRGQLVSRLMREEGMTLPEASRYIKENQLI